MYVYSVTFSVRLTPSISEKLVEKKNPLAICKNSTTLSTHPQSKPQKLGTYWPVSHRLIDMSVASL